MPNVGQPVGDHLIGRAGRQLTPDGGEAQDAVDGGDVEIAVALGHAARQRQALRDGDHFRPLAGERLRHGIDLALGPASDEQGTVAGQGHLAGVPRLRGDDADLESFGQLQLADVRMAAARTREQERGQCFRCC